ncbi:MAG: hypothetical protein M0Z81_11070 [Deltaproteobacteria bacterium]|nr:hypothetical protein [Deltaproteobacteria bacterium]
MEKKLEDARVFFDSLEKFLAHTADQSTEELELELQEEGVDTHGLVSRVKSIVHEKLNEARLHWQKEAEEERRVLLPVLLQLPVRPGMRCRERRFLLVFRS